MSKNHMTILISTIALLLVASIIYVLTRITPKDMNQDSSNQVLSQNTDTNTNVEEEITYNPHALGTFLTQAKQLIESQASQDTDTDTETGSESKVETTPQFDPNYVSYADKCALDYVATPIIFNTREEVLAHIKLLAAEYPEMETIYNNEALYSDNIMVSLANNPEMLDYVLGYTKSDGSVTGGINEYEMAQEYPLFLQWDPRWGYMPYGPIGVIGTSGCGPTSLSMAIFYLTRNPEVTPDAVATYSLNNGYYVKGSGTSWSMIDIYPTIYNLTSTRISSNEASLKAELDKGNILVCSVYPGDFTYGGHFLVIYGYDEKGFKINDPKCVYRSRLIWAYNTIQDDLHQVWSIGK